MNADITFCTIGNSTQPLYAFLLLLAGSRIVLGADVRKRGLTGSFVTLLCDRCGHYQKALFDPTGTTSTVSNWRPCARVCARRSNAAS